MSHPRTLRRFAWVSPLLLLALATPSPAQDDAERQAEIRQLEEILARVDTALTRLDPLLSPSLRQYDIRQLLYRASDNPGPTLTIPAEDGGYRTGAGGGFSFDDEEEEPSTLDPGQIEELIQDTLGQEEWEDPHSLEISRGYIFVRQTEANHARIERLLTDLRRAELRSLRLEVGFYVLSPRLKRLVQEAALANDGVLSLEVLSELEDAVSAGEAQLKGQALLTSLNEQRVYLHHGLEQAIVSDFEQSAGGTGDVVETVVDPVVDVLLTGLVLDVRGTIVQGRSPGVSLDVRFTRTRPVAIEQRKTPWGKIDTPRIAVDSVRTSARVPPSSGMLVYSSEGGQADQEDDVTIVVRPLVIEAK